MQPPPLAPAALERGSPPPMPPHLQNMMLQMRKRQPKFQLHGQASGPSQHSGGRRSGRGRGRGRGGVQQPNNRPTSALNKHLSQSKRKKGPSTHARDALKFFMPSFVEDPWTEFTANTWDGGEEGANRSTQSANAHLKFEMLPRPVLRCGTHAEPGRVLFQPTFLDDPWMWLVPYCTEQ